MGFYEERKTRGLSGFGGDGNGGVETQQLRACGRVSASKGCIPEDTFPITVVALCHPAVSPKLPGEQHKGELAQCGL